MNNTKAPIVLKVGKPLTHRKSHCSLCRSIVLYADESVLCDSGFFGFFAGRFVICPVCHSSISIDAERSETTWCDEDGNV